MDASIASNLLKDADSLEPSTITLITESASSASSPSSSSSVSDGSCSECSVSPFMQDDSPDDILIDDITRGMVYSTIAVASDEAGAMKAIEKSTPWNIEALKFATGSSEITTTPLSMILRDLMDMSLDCELQEHTKLLRGVEIDINGYIAHNDDYIVLSYHSRTSPFSWLDNFDEKTSTFSPDFDPRFKFGPRHFFSPYGDYCCGSLPAHVRCEGMGGEVHSWFYHNFLTSIHMIKTHIDPLLDDQQRRRKLFVTGNSLAGGVASLAACYFLIKYDWTMLPHMFVHVTAGSPRVLTSDMRKLIEDRLIFLGDSVAIHRVVNGQDVMPTVPASTSGFEHMVAPTCIDNEGNMIVHALRKEEDTDLDSVAGMFTAASSDGSGSKKTKTQYEYFLDRFPRPLRDHMPAAYLRPVFRLRGIFSASELERPLPITRLVIRKKAKKRTSDSSLSKATMAEIEPSKSGSTEDAARKSKKPIRKMGKAMISKMFRRKKEC